ncbi:MAG: glutaredoxin family protein [Candidatus Methanomethylophilaceae archaeon]|jgi:glutaredoxin
MAEIKLFTKDNCGKCEYVLERIPEGIRVETVNVDTVDGLAEGAFYQILNMTFPVLVVDGTVKAEGSINSLKVLKEISEQK